MAEKAFRDWIAKLDEDVIQGEFGFEEGEFEVFPDDWRPLYDEGLTPREAYQRALDAAKAARSEQDQPMTPDTHNKLAFGRRTISSVLQELKALHSILHAAGLDKLGARVGHAWDDLERAHTLIDEGISEAVHDTVQGSEQDNERLRTALADVVEQLQQAVDYWNKADRPGLFVSNSLGSLDRANEVLADTKG